MPGRANFGRDIPERRIRRCQPSLLSLLLDWRIILALLGCWLVFPLFFVLWRCIELLCTKYYITSDRIRVIQGIFNQITDEIELFRVLDIQLKKPLLYRFVSLANIHVETVDRNNRQFTLMAITDADSLFDKIRISVLEARRRHRPDPPYPF